MANREILGTMRALIYFTEVINAQGVNSFNFLRNFTFLQMVYLKNTITTSESRAQRGLLLEYHYFPIIIFVVDFFFQILMISSLFIVDFYNI